MLRRGGGGLCDLDVVDHFLMAEPMRGKTKACIAERVQIFYHRIRPIKDRFLVRLARDRFNETHLATRRIGGVSLRTSIHFSVPNTRIGIKCGVCKTALKGAKIDVNDEAEEHMTSAYLLPF